MELLVNYSAFLGGALHPEMAVHILAAFHL